MEVTLWGFLSSQWVCKYIGVKVMSSRLQRNILILVKVIRCIFCLRQKFKVMQFVSLSDGLWVSVRTCRRHKPCSLPKQTQTIYSGYSGSVSEVQLWREPKWIQWHCSRTRIVHLLACTRNVASDIVAIKSFRIEVSNWNCTLFVKF